MRAFLLAAAVLLGACASPVTLNYYQLPAVTTESTHSDAAAALYVAPVQVASYLNGRGLVLQLSEVELNVARQHLWAEPLDAQVQRQRCSGSVSSGSAVQRRFWQRQCNRRQRRGSGSGGGAAATGEAAPEQASSDGASSSAASPAADAGGRGQMLRCCGTG